MVLRLQLLKDSFKLEGVMLMPKNKSEWRAWILGFIIVGYLTILVVTN